MGMDDMRRLRLSAPRGKSIRYRSVDTIHDAAICMLTAAGASAETLIGEKAKVWGAGTVFPRKGNPQTGELSARAVVISTIDPELSEIFSRIDTSQMRSVRNRTGERVDLTGWTIEEDPAPVVDGMSFLPAMCGSPIAISHRVPTQFGKWFRDFRDGDVQGRVNERLSRMTGREVRLRLSPDQGYIDSKRSHAVHCRIKADQPAGVVVAMSLPLLIEGSPDDLETAWYAGIGEKTRMGFGILCAA